jgi:steroid delta-isomerase-like uncharacterized protein
MTDPTQLAHQLAERYVALLNERAMDAFEEVLDPDIVSHLRIGDIKGSERFRGLMEQTYEAFPGIVWEVYEYICTPGRAVIRYYFDAVQRGPWLGMPASHRMVHLEGVEVLHIEEGRIREIWNYADVMGIAAQLRAADPLALRFDD